MIYAVDLHPLPTVTEIRHRRRDGSSAPSSIRRGKVTNVRIWQGENGKWYVAPGIESVYDFVPPFNAGTNR